MLRGLKVFYAPDEPSGGASDKEPTVEQLQQQVAEKENTIKELTAIKTKVEKGELVSPTEVLDKAVENGEYFKKDRYVGLQNKLQKEQEAKEKLQEDLGLLKNQVLELSTEKDGLSASVTEFETTVTGKDEQISKLEKDKKRASLIFAEFPELAAFEADGLLPDAEDETILTEKFTAFSKKLNLMEEAGAKKFAAGGGSITPGKKTEPASGNADAFLKLANDAALSGNTQAYNENFEKYLAALKDNK